MKKRVSTLSISPIQKIKYSAMGIFALLIISSGCLSTGSMANIQPKAGTIDLPAKGEFRIWKDITHPGFSVTLKNPSATQSCEVYKVAGSGSEKWISPSLMAGKSLTISVPSNGHLFFKNFNDNVLKIDYVIE
jgi:hypothetical protein